MAFGDAFGGGGFEVPLAPFPPFGLSPFGEPLPGLLAPDGWPFGLFPPFCVPLGGFPGAAGTVASLAGTAVAFAFVLA